MRKTKKGALTQNKIITIIILIIVAAILIAYFGVQYSRSKSLISKQDCFNSVVARNNALTRGEVVQVEFYPLRCKSEEVKIDNSDEEEIQKTIANAMYDCWWMLGEGKMTFLKDKAYIRLMPNDNSEEMACVLCSTITFNKKVKEKNLDVDIMSYLEKTKIPLEDKTYLDFFTNSESSKLEVIENSGDTSSINTGQDYAVIYFSIKGGEIGNEILRNLMPNIIWGSLSASLGPDGVGLYHRLVTIPRINAYLEKVKVANAHCEAGLKGCNILMLVPLNEQSFATCRHFSNIP